MRIRKRAKISSLLHAPPSLSPCALQTQVCHLNQSPWDVMTFAPPPPYQDGVFDCNGSSGRRDSAPEREGDQELDCYSEEPETKVACCKTDGKNWKCRREAATGSSYCKHHISQAKSYNNLPSKKPKKTSTSNPSEFYYYSGFGPRWGKKRGENSNDEIKNDSGNVKKNDDEIERAVAASKHNSDVGKKRGRKPIKTRSLKSLM